MLAPGLPERRSPSRSRTRTTVAATSAATTWKAISGASAPMTHADAWRGNGIRISLSLLCPHHEFGPFGSIARESKIPNADDAILFPIQENKVLRPSRHIVRIAHEDRRPSVNESRNEVPVVNEGVVVEVCADLGSAAQATPVHEVEPNVVGEHVADRVEVACVEALNVEALPRLSALGLLLRAEGSRRPRRARRQRRLPARPPSRPSLRWPDGRQRARRTR
jgi:hypothetical protein